MKPALKEVFKVFLTIKKSLPQFLRVSKYLIKNRNFHWQGKYQKFLPILLLRHFLWDSVFLFMFNMGKPKWNMSEEIGFSLNFALFLLPKNAFSLYFIRVLYCEILNKLNQKIKLKTVFTVPRGLRIALKTCVDIMGLSIVACEKRLLPLHSLLVQVLLILLMQVCGLYHFLFTNK